MILSELKPHSATAFGWVVAFSDSGVSVAPKNGILPEVKEVLIKEGELLVTPIGFKGLVVTGTLTAAQRNFEAETSFYVSSENFRMLAIEDTKLLDFTNT